MRTSLYNIKHMCEETLNLKRELMTDGKPTVVISLNHENNGDTRELFGTKGKVVERIPQQGIDAVLFDAEELLRGVNKALKRSKES